MNDSIFKSSIRAFFVTLSVIFALLAAMLIFSLMYSSSEEKNKSKIKIDSDYKPYIEPNALNIRKEMSSTTPVILEIPIIGPIGTEKLNTSTIRQLLIESREGDLKDDRVVGILLHIDSPGGTVDDADGIYEAIMDYKQFYDVPVYAFLEGVCASGGMYIACAADKIYSRDSTLVGSIGVLISTLFNVSDVLKKVGVDTLTLTAGKNKDMLNPFRPWKEGEQGNLQDVVNAYYNKFVDIVVKNRPKVDRAALTEKYGAQIYLAEEAATIGLVDFPNSSRSKALAALVETLEIEDDKYQVVTLHKKSWLLEFLSNEDNTLFRGHVHHHIDLGDVLPKELRGKFLYLYRPDL